jgi:hypothetical protein
MKKLLVIVAMLGLGLSVQSQSMVSTNVYAAGVHLLTPNRATVYSIEISSTNAYSYKLWDNDNLTHVPTAASTPGWWGTNFVNGAYISRSSYATNISSSYTNPIGGISWYTNMGLWTVTSTNAASTNVVSPVVTISTGGAETRVSYVNATFVRGILLGVTGPGSVTVYYKSEQ